MFGCLWTLIKLVVISVVVACFFGLVFAIGVYVVPIFIGLVILRSLIRWIIK